LAAAAVVVLIAGVAVVARLSSTNRKGTTAVGATTTTASRSAAPQRGAPVPGAPSERAPSAQTSAGGAAAVPGQFGPAAGAGSAGDTARPARAVVVGVLGLGVGGDAVATTLDHVEKIARDAGGLTADRTGSGVVVRVPTSAYDDVLARAKQLGTVTNA